MKHRGRRSSAELAIAVRPVEIVERQRSPHELNDEETEVWAAVTEALPADWFDKATTPMLTQYCRHVVQARRVAELIERATGDPELAASDYDRLLKMQERESRAITTLATKMRISQQSTINQRANKIIQEAKPWER